MVPAWWIVCPKCDGLVDRVDGEYARHGDFRGRLCVMSRRRIPRAPGTNHALERPVQRD